MATQLAGDPVVETRIRCLEPSLRGVPDLVYSKQTRHEITASVDVQLHDARRLPADETQLEQLRDRGFTMAKFWDDDLHPQLNKFLLNFDPAMRHRSGEDGHGSEDQERSKAVRDRLYAQGAAWAQRALGAKHVFPMTHTCRYGNQGHADGKAYITSYATFAHCDYTTRIVKPEASWKALVAYGMPEDEARSMDVGYYNIWRKHI